MQFFSTLSSLIAVIAAVSAYPNAAAPDVSGCPSITALGSLAPSGPNSVSTTIPCTVSPSHQIALGVVDATQPTKGCPYFSWSLKPLGMQKLEVRDTKDDSFITTLTAGDMKGKPMTDPIRCPASANLKVVAYFDDISHASNYYLESMGV